MIAKVILNNKEQNIDQVFDYKIPDTLKNKAELGMRVKVPFGFKNNKVEGIIIGFCEESKFEKLKEVSQVIGTEPVCSAKMLELCLWISDRYFCSLYQAIRLITPPGMTAGVKAKTENYAKLAISPDEAFKIKDELRE